MVVVAKNHLKMDVVFTVVANICNVVKTSTKRQEIFLEAQADETLKGLESCELKSERGLNQKMGLKRAGALELSLSFNSELDSFVLLYDCNT